MSKHQSKIEKLIAELCPEGVEVLSFDNVITSLRTGLNPRQNFKLNPPNAKNYYITVRELDGFDIRISDKTDRVDNAGLALIQNRSKLRAGDILFSATGTIGRTALVSDMPTDWNIKEGIYAITPNPKIIDARFLIHLLHSEKICSQILSQSDGSTVSSIPMASLRKVTLSVPPLAIQQEIVKILDTFTTLEAELEAELEARKKQYEYYREELLTFGEDVEWKTLGEVCFKTENIKWKENQEIDYQYVDLFSVSRENNKISETQTINSTNAPSRAQQIIKKDDVIFGTTRPTLKRYSLIDSKYNNQICSTGFCVLRANQEVILPKFLFFILKTMNFYCFVESNQEGAGYPSISNSKVKEFPVPIPPLAEQERIVTILDKFDALVNDISVGLPAELNARRKQYEYYRNKLLTFKGLSSRGEEPPRPGGHPSKGGE